MRLAGGDGEVVAVFKEGLLEGSHVREVIMQGGNSLTRDIGSWGRRTCSLQPLYTEKAANVFGACLCLLAAIWLLAFSQY